MNAEQIVGLLALKHSRDLFVPECKDGPTQAANHRRLDAWAMARSWAHPAFYGYEVKVSRADWLKDQKVETYLPMCNLLSLVAPRGVIQPEELPASVGLLEVASTGNRLLTRRKAAYREIAPPFDTLVYILMCRVRVQRERWAGEDDEAAERESLREWAAGRGDRLETGGMVAARIRERIRAGVKEADERREKAEDEARRLRFVDGVLQKLGIDPEKVDVGWYGQQQIQARISEACGNGLLQSLRAARAQLEAAEERIAGACGDPAMDRPRTRGLG